MKEDDIRTYDHEGDVGYIVECDLGYPEHLHELHNDYPLAPERRCVNADMLSPYTEALYRKTYDIDADKAVPDEKA